MSRFDIRVLVLANSTLINGLLHAYLDHEGYTPLEPAPGESPEQALERLRPRIVLLDCDTPGGCEQPFLDRIRAAGARVVVFGPGRDDGFVNAFAGERGLDWFGMPIDRGRFASVLGTAGTG